MRLASSAFSELMCRCNDIRLLANPNRINPSAMYSKSLHFNVPVVSDKHISSNASIEA